MDGLTYEISGNSSLAFVHTFSDEMKTALKDQLAEICYGRKLAAENATFYSFKATLRQFMERYASKRSKTQTGMIGELLTHLLIRELHPDLEPTSIFFNKEEKNIKKGFDLTFVDSPRTAIWYTEVKAGRLGRQGLASKITRLLNDAASDLASKLNSEKRQSLWDSAMYDVSAILADPQGLTVREMLRDDATEAMSPAPPLKNAVLVAVLFHPLTTPDHTAAELLQQAERIRKRKRFAALRVIAIRKSTLEAIVDYLKAEASA